MEQSKKNTKGGLAPALLLMFAAPLLTEVLPGATRFSSIFVLPIEICVWGGGALLIRYAMKRWNLGWLNILLMALALALAEECVIQQTSLAPMVIRLKGVTYAREFGVNYVYLLWALIYESTFVVFLPVYLLELIFPDRRENTWVSKTGLFLVILFFILGSILAWFSWTQIARPKVFHMPVFHPPFPAMAIAFVTICGLISIALGPLRKRHMASAALSKLPPVWLIGLSGMIWAALLFGLVLLGFGIAPDFPPLIAVCGGLLLFGIPVFFLPRWAADSRWQHHQFALIFGVMIGSMMISFVGFLDTRGPDLYFKIITNIIAVVLMIILGYRLRRRAIQL